MSFTNKFTGKVLIIGVNDYDLPGSLRINFPVDLDSSVTVRAETYNDILSSVDVKYRGFDDLPSSVQPSLSVDLPSSVSIRPHNKMTGIVEIVEPPVIKANLSPIEDTYAREDMPKLNYGHDHDMFVGVNWGGNKYRSFLRFDISSIPLNKKIKKATIVLERLNSLPAIPIGIYDVLQGEVWTEYGLTWDNQPRYGTLIKTYNSGSYAGRTEIDITSYITEWYEGKRDHNGFMLKALDESVLGRYKQYGTRESDLPPYIEVEYFDPTIYSYKRDDIKSSVFVFARNDYDVESSVVVKGYVDKYDLEGSLTVRDPKIPVDDDLLSSVGVNRDTLPSSVLVFQVSDSELPSSIFVRNTSSDDFSGSVVVNRPELDGSVNVKPYADLASSIHVKGLEEYDLDSTVVVNAPEREGSVVVKPYNDLEGSIISRVRRDADLESTVVVNAPDRPGSVYVRHYSDIEGFVAVRQADETYIESSVIINKPDIDSSIYVKPYADLEGIVVSRVQDNADLEWSIFIRSEYLKSTVQVRRTLEDYIDSSVTVRKTDWDDLQGSVIPRVYEDNDLHSSVAVRRELNKDLLMSVVPRVVGASDVPSTVEIEVASNLPSSVIVRAEKSDDLDSSVLVIHSGWYDMPSQVSVWAVHDLDSSVIVRYLGHSDLNGSVRTRVTGVGDLPSSVEVVVDDGAYVFIL